MWIHLNGRLVDEAEARIPVFDRGLLFGDGIFETMRSVAGRIFRLGRHLGRLERSARLIGLALPWQPARAGALLGELLEANGLKEARIRLTITRGPGRPGDYLAAEGPPTVIATAAPFTPLGTGLYESGVRVAIADRRAVPGSAIDASIKSISRLASVLARREARAKGAFEAILLDADGCLTEGTASNLFLVERGGLATPPVPAGGLPGITRETILELARSADLRAREEPLPAERLSAAEEAFLTNTSWEVLPVTRVDGRSIGEGRIGPVTLDLLARYRDLLRRECSGD